MDNYSSDWGAHRTRCGHCGAWYHPSGAEECLCRFCESCRTRVTPGENDTRRRGDEVLCADCAPTCDACGAEAAGCSIEDGTPLCRACLAAYSDPSVRADQVAHVRERLRVHGEEAMANPAATRNALLNLIRSGVLDR